MMARVRGVISDSTVAGSSSIVTASGSASTGVRAVGGDGEHGRDEGVGGHDHLIPRAQTEGADDQRERIQSVADADARLRAEQKRANSVSNAAVCGPRIV